MLVKLLKYEFKACGRMLLPLYAALCALSLINGFTFRLEYSLITGIAITLTSALSFAIAACSVYLIIQRFWTNLLKDEGYLMFTLPVSTAQLISAKLISGIAWVIISTLIGLLAMLLWFAPLNWSVIQEFVSHLPSFYTAAMQQFEAMNINPFITMLQLLIIPLAGGAYQILMLYCAMAVGQLPLVSKHRVLASTGAFVLLHMIAQNLVIIIARTATSYDAINQWLNNTQPNLILALLILVILLGCSIFFGLTNYLLKNKLNLE